jgi:regulatory protein
MPKITALTMQEKNKKKCNLFLDGEFYAGVFVETVLKNRLKVGMEIDQQELADLMFESDKIIALEKSVAYTTKNMKTKRQVITYLQGKGFSNDVVFYCIDKLIEYNLINDIEYAKRYVESTAKKQGKHLTQFMLSTKGVKKEDIAKLDPEPLISEDFSYVFGQLTRTYKKPGKELSPSNVYVIQNNKKVTLKKLLEDYINVRCKNFESMMGLGSHVIHVKHLRAILGNNYTKRHVLNFNEKLIHFSMELIDSVILHELCHDYEANHSKRFYDLLNHYCPNYQAKRQKLVYGVKR